jgi:hypothetical protein
MLRSPLLKIIAGMDTSYRKTTNELPLGKSERFSEIIEGVSRYLLKKGMRSRITL